MPIGRSAIESYKLVKRHTVFSHDELVCKMASSKLPIDMESSLAVERELALINEAERRDRQMLVQRGLVSQSRRLHFEILPDDERTCAFCKTTCFVSAIRCSCQPNKLACITHIEHVCNATKRKQHRSRQRNNNNNTNKQAQSPAATIQHRYTLIYRYSMAELQDMLVKLEERRFAYEEWCARVRAILVRQARTKVTEVDSDIEEIPVDGDDSNKSNTPAKMSEVSQ